MTLARRSFIAGSAAAAATVAGPALAAVGPDPIFAAIAAWQAADDEWMARLDLYSVAEDACQAERALNTAELQIDFHGIPFTFRTDSHISFFLRSLPHDGTRAREERQLALSKEWRAALAAERQRVETVQTKHNFVWLEEHASEAGDAQTEAQRVVVTTVPTTLAGVRALAEFMTAPNRLHEDHFSPGLASIAAAMTALAPRA
ncbi:MAG: hypothetical protein C0522_11315 [Rhodocyclaceae bacterium]|nr:hypothetical protein [Rhodocyclaceae bacterium]